MSWRVRVLATPAIAAGFRLAGLTVDEVATSGEAGTKLVLAAAQPDVGILLVEQKLLDAMPEVTRREAERRALPILVPIPEPSWGAAAGDAESYILELLRRSIGYRVRLQ
ncbi:MAG: V-type ATP synthase subunit F [Gemmatimonadales bacterium]